MSAEHSAGSVGTGDAARPAPWPRMAMALAANELRLAARRGESLLITFVIPAGVLLRLQRLRHQRRRRRPANPVDRMLPGSMALAIIAASMVSLAIATGFERAYGVIKRLGGSPAGTSVLVASKTVAVIAVEAIQVAAPAGDRRRCAGLGRRARPCPCRWWSRGCSWARSRSRASAC